MSTLRMSAILYKTGMGGCTLFVAYRLTMLKVFPSLFANSVWLTPLAFKFYLANTHFLYRKVLPLHYINALFEKANMRNAVKLVGL